MSFMDVIVPILSGVGAFTALALLVMLGLVAVYCIKMLWKAIQE